MAGAELAFVLDPIDGTSNYAAGLPLFGTMVAAIVRGEVVAAVIHDPVVRRLRTGAARRGRMVGTPAGGTQAVCSVADPVPSEQMAGACRGGIMPEPLRGMVLPQPAARWRGAATTAVPRTQYRMACGRALPLRWCSTG